MQTWSPTPAAFPSRRAHSVDIDLAADDEVGAGPGVQVGRGRGRGGQKQAVPALSDVGQPGGVRRLGDRLVGAGENPSVAEVEVGRLWQSVAYLQRGRGLGRIGESDHLSQPNRADLVIEMPQHATSLDRRQLLIIAQQPYDRARGECAIDDPSKHQRSRHPGLVDQDHRPRRDRRLVMVELRQGVRLDPSSSPSTSAATADGANATIALPEASHASATTRMAVVLPDPAGASPS